MPEALESHRKHTRVPLYVPVEWKISDLALSGVTVNVGNGGASVHLNKSEAASVKAVPGVRTTLRLLFPNKLLAVQARLVWRRNESDAQGEVKNIQVGFAFDLDEESGPAIREVLQAFQYRILVLDWPADAELGFLAESYELQRGDEESIAGACDDRSALILMGNSHPGGGLEPLQRILRATRGEAAPPILFASETVSPELETILANEARVFHQRRPVSQSQLRSVVRRLVDAQVLRRENERLAVEFQSMLDRLWQENEFFRTRLVETTRFHGLIGESAAMQQVYGAVERVAPMDTTVLLVGETGTGKGVIARALHQKSKRASGAFVTQNCAALPETLLDSELFGHSRGAFTGAVGDRAGLFEAAKGGTVFLDEITEMSAGMQAKLLHVLQESRVRRIGTIEEVNVDVRIICATNQNLEQLVSRSRFREDLYYRLVSFVVRLPPLRERVDDVAKLAVHFLAQFAVRNRTEPKAITADALRILESHSWPGNVRELQHAVERMAILCAPGQPISAALAQEALSVGRPAPSPSTKGGVSLNDELIAHEKRLVTAALEKARWVIADAARQLGVNRTTLSKRLKRLGISLPSEPPHEDAFGASLRPHESRR